MSDALSNRQRRNQIARKGRPVLSLEFDVFLDGDVSMWAHTRHDIPFPQMQAAFEAIQAHLARFISDADMCPFNPALVNDATVVASTSIV